MTQDHDPNVDYDAWIAPPAPDITDAVIARAREPVGTATEVDAPKRSARPLLLAGGALALSVAVIVVAVVIDRSKQPPPAPTISDLRIEQLEQQVDDLEAAIEKLNAIGATPSEPEDAPAPATVEPTEAPVEQKGQPATKPACDYAKLYAAGKGHYGNHQWSAALATFEQALECKQTDDASTLAALSACNSGRPTEAKRHFARVPDSRRPAVQQSCLAKNIDVTAADSPVRPAACDWQALQDEGVDFFRKSQWSAALASFEKSYDCKADLSTALYAALSACKARRVAEAKRWYQRSAEDKRPHIQQTCLQKGIDLQ